MEFKGVDLSYVQEGIDCKKLKENGVDFAIIRLGLSDHADVTATGHIKGCLENKIDYGFYWYSYAMSVEEAKEEAKACIRELNELSDDEKPIYPVFFDMEEARQAQLLSTPIRTSMAITFCEELKKAGYLTGIYANPSWMETYYDKTKIVGKYDIWLAHWTGNPKYKTRYNYGQKLWQWGLDNMGGYNVDGDICYVDYKALQVENDKTAVSTKKINEGAIVTVNKGAKFSNGVEPYPFVYNTTFTILKMSKDKNEALIGIPGKGTTGWMYVNDLTVQKNADTPTKPTTSTTPTTTKKIDIGSIVKIKDGANFSNGVKPDKWTIGYKFVVQNISRDKKEALIGIKDSATGWVYIKDLILC